MSDVSPISPSIPAPLQQTQQVAQSIQIEESPHHSLADSLEELGHLPTRLAALGKPL